jgi:hypothetical protein
VFNCGKSISQKYDGPVCSLEPSVVETTTQWLNVCSNRAGGRLTVGAKCPARDPAHSITCGVEVRTPEASTFHPKRG